MRREPSLRPEPWIVMCWGFLGKSLSVRVPDYQIYIFYANQETIAYDQETAAQLREKHRKSLILFAGPYATVVPEKILTSPAVDAVIRGELEEPLRELCDNKPLSSIQGLTWKDGDGHRHQSGLPEAGRFGLTFLGISKLSVAILPLLNYRIPYLNYPYISLLSGRGCPNHCTYCLWPQTITGHRYRTRNISDVAEEMIWIHKTLPMQSEKSRLRTILLPVTGSACSNYVTLSRVGESPGHVALGTIFRRRVIQNEKGRGSESRGRVRVRK